MLNQRLAAAQKVAVRLHAAEEALDAALAETAHLTASMPTARAEAGVSAMFGQDALLFANEAISALVAARGALLETHRKLDETKNQMGLRTYMGPGGPKPIPTGGEESQPVRLSVVGEAS
ncbi:hypothetical protein KCG44_06210 [Pacificimonas sp. WHA3]|uniref:Uncharacterized protein n=1 Tax=Pacificimonas pallii TaxID=2827236 RepID=A0ABS6SD96_9SPHN|nr:hypothetical protein [Pacificimonas pallii]MBV7256378.1 hypothetical protein [Pacificimonas pallii]